MASTVDSARIGASSTAPPDRSSHGLNLVVPKAAIPTSFADPTWPPREPLDGPFRRPVAGRPTAGCRCGVTVKPPKRFWRSRGAGPDRNLTATPRRIHLYDQLAHLKVQPPARHREPVTVGIPHGRRLVPSARVGLMTFDLRFPRRTGPRRRQGRAFRGPAAWVAGELLRTGAQLLAAMQVPGVVSRRGGAPPRVAKATKASLARRLGLTLAEEV